MKLGIITDSEQLNQPQWRTYDDEGKEQTRFLIRPFTRTSQAAIEKRSKVTKADDDLPDTGQKGEAYTRTLADYLLVDWEGVCDAASGDPLPCDARNKVYLFENLDIALWIIEEARKLNVKRLESDAKNSKS